jgi:hypothetical protein
MIGVCPTEGEKFALTLNASSESTVNAVLSPNSAAESSIDCIPVLFQLHSSTSLTSESEITYQLDI